MRRFTPAVVVLIALLCGPRICVAQETSSLRITSPLGRTGTVTRIRIVAQITVSPGAGLSPVDFYVDGEKVGTVANGPPYAVDWTDDNPLLRREIAVQAADATGAVLRDTVILPPWEVSEETEVAGVLLETSVFDEKGHAVSQLPNDAFAVTEDDVPQPIDLVTREQVPTDLVVLVDNSQSMAARMDRVRRAVERLVEHLRPKDRAIVAPFNVKIGTITGPTNDKETISQAIVAMRAGGGTALLDSLQESTALLKGAEGRRALVLITDGFDENSQATVESTIEAIERVGVTVYAIGIGGVAGISLRGQDTIKKIVGPTGGRAYFPPADRDLVEAVRSITTDSQSRFLITYTPANQKKDGAWRAVAVKVPEGYRVRTRAGYFAPPPLPIHATAEFTLMDDKRRYVEVTRDDLEVFENGEPQAITTFQEAVDPVSIVLALDESGSMKKSADLVRATAKDFVGAVRPEDSLALITFADAPKFAHVLALNRQWTYDAIDHYTPTGGTALYDALWNALQHLKGVPARKAVVVLTDGRDENNPGTAPGSTHVLDDVIKLQREVGATIFAVGLGANVDVGVMERLAEVSGGQRYEASDATALGDQFRRIIEDLRRRYILGYVSSNIQHDGSWRAIEIRPKQADRIVLTSAGYFAPEK
jgi:VWFA-related protein